MKYTHFLLVVVLLFTSRLVGEEIIVSGPTRGYFSKDDPTLDGLKWGNWGSRPYEYKWASTVVQVKDKKVIDLGVGLPSLYNWFAYVVEVLQPSFYVGVDLDCDMLKEQMTGLNYEMKYMSMTDLAYEDNEFDIAYCISTFEHLSYEVFMQSIREAYRVLKNEGVLVVTLDERWDKNLPLTSANKWNDLEQSLLQNRILNDLDVSSFGLNDFLGLVSDYFVPYDRELSSVGYQKTNRDPLLLNSGDLYNSCVSFVVLRKKE